MSKRKAASPLVRLCPGHLQTKEVEVFVSAALLTRGWPVLLAEVRMSTGRAVKLESFVNISTPRLRAVHTCGPSANGEGFTMSVKVTVAYECPDPESNQSKWEVGHTFQQGLQFHGEDLTLCVECQNALQSQKKESHHKCDHPGCLKPMQCGSNFQFFRCTGQGCSYGICETCQACKVELGDLDVGVHQLMRIRLAVQQNPLDQPFPTSQDGIDLEAGPKAFKDAKRELWEKLNGLQSGKKFRSGQVGNYCFVFGQRTLQLPAHLAHDFCPLLAAVAQHGDVCNKDAEAASLGIDIELVHNAYMCFFSYLVKDGEALWFENLSPPQKWAMLLVLHRYLPGSEVTQVLFENLERSYASNIDGDNVSCVMEFATRAGAMILHLAAAKASVAILEGHV